MVQEKPSYLKWSIDSLEIISSNLLIAITCFLFVTGKFDLTVVQHWEPVTHQILTTIKNINKDTAEQTQLNHILYKLDSVLN